MEFPILLITVNFTFSVYDVVLNILLYIFPGPWLVIVSSKSVVGLSDSLVSVYGYLIGFPKYSVSFVFGRTSFSFIKDLLVPLSHC